MCDNNILKDANYKVRKVMAPIPVRFKKDANETFISMKDSEKWKTKSVEREIAKVTIFVYA